MIVNICGECMAEYEATTDDFEGTCYTPTCACDAESVEVEARVSLREAWAAHRIYVESKWADLHAACERKRADQEGLYMHRGDGLTWTEADRRKRWRNIAQRKAMMLDVSGRTRMGGFSALLDGATEDFRRSINRQVFGTGPSFTIPVSRAQSSVELMGLKVIADDTLTDSTILAVDDTSIFGPNFPRGPGEVKVANSVLEWDDRETHDQVYRAWLDQSLRPSIITSPGVKRQYDALLKKSGVITGIGV